MSPSRPGPAPEQTAPANVATPPSDAPASPRADLHDAIGWIVFGLVVTIASWRMDRLVDQHINPVTVPGLVPGLLGLGMMLIGAIMSVRSWQRGALHEPKVQTTAVQHQQRKRVLLAVVLCVGYSVVLIGRGLPFWLASSAYVTVSILVFDRIGSDPVKRQMNARNMGKALLIGVLASIVVWLVFERLFLVRLP